MKKLKLSIFLSISFMNLNAQIGTWTSKASLSFSRATHVGFTLMGKGYICAGASASANLKDLWQYDPVTNSWSQKADMPGDPRQELASFVIGNYAYVGHGRYVASSEIFYSFNKYDPNTNTWSAIADCPVQRFSSTGFSIDTLGYVTCGLGGNRYKDLYAYSPKTNSWSQKASLPSAALERSFATVATVNHKAYLMGGYCPMIVDDFYEYNPVTNVWISRAKYPGGGRYVASSLAIGNYILMGLGKDASSTDYKDWYYYMPGTNTWTKMNDYPADNIGGNATFVINGKGYVCAGTNKASDIRDYLYELNASSLNINATFEKNVSFLNPYFSFSSQLLYCNSFKGKFEVKIFDISGKKVFTEISYNQNDGNLSFNINQLPKGIYIAYLENEGLSKLLKISMN